MQQNQIKRQIAEAAIQFVQDGMTIGLGTGTTATEFIKKLASEKRKVTCVASSIASEKLALSLGLKCISIEKLSHIDITFDGADEIDVQKRIIKGAGGALLREKILAYASRSLIILVDETKCVDLLGKAKLPVEITPFGHNFTIKHLEELGYQGALRVTSDESFYVTDNHNFIFDIYFPEYLQNPEEEEKKITSIPGVVETGFFFNLPLKVIVGNEHRIIVME